jgi:hypothetical protein
VTHPLRRLIASGAVLAIAAGLLTGTTAAIAADPAPAIFEGFLSVEHFGSSPPIAGACAMATTDGVTELATACADAQGRFQLQVPRGVAFAVRITAPERPALWARTGLTFESAARYLAVPGSGSFVPSIEAVVPDPGVASVAGRITDQSDHPVAGVLVRVGRDQYEGYARTDSDGRFALDNVPAGLVTVFNGIGPQQMVLIPGQAGNADRRLDAMAGVVDFVAVDSTTGAPAAGLCLWANGCGAGATTSLILPAGPATRQVSDQTVDGFGTWKGLVGAYPNYYYKPADVAVDVLPGTRMTQRVLLEPATFLDVSATDLAGNPTRVCFYPVPTHLPLGTVDLRFRNADTTCHEYEQSNFLIGPLPPGAMRVFAIANSGEMGWLTATGLTGDQKQAKVWALHGGFLTRPPLRIDPYLSYQVRGVAWDPVKQEQVAVCAHPFAESVYLRWPDDWLNESLSPNHCMWLASIAAGRTPIPVLLTGDGYAPVWVDSATSRANARLLQPGDTYHADTWDVVLQPAGTLQMAGGATEVTLFDAYSGDQLSPSALNTGRVFVRYRFNATECWYTPVSLRRFIPGGTAQLVRAGATTTLTVSSLTCQRTAPALLSPGSPFVPRRKAA